MSFGNMKRKFVCQFTLDNFLLSDLHFIPY